MVASRTLRPGLEPLSSQSVGLLGGGQIGELPTEALAKVVRGEVIRVLPLGHHRDIGLPLGLETVIHTHQDHLLESQVEGQLQGHVGDRRAFEQPSGRPGGEGGRASVVGVQEDDSGIASQVIPGSPGDELG
jgi:hypothetical protein